MATQLDHIILRVNDRASAIEFYTRILGLKYEGERNPFSVIRVTPEFQIQIAPWDTKAEGILRSRCRGRNLIRYSGEL